MIPAAWEILPLATLAGTTVFCAWRWRKERDAHSMARTDLRLVRTGLAKYKSLTWLNKALLAQAKAGREAAEASMESMAAALADTEDRLRAIERQRSETTRRGNLTRYARQRAAKLVKAPEMGGRRAG